MNQEIFRILKSDWRSLRISLLVFCTTILLTIGLGLSADNYYQSHKKALENHSRNHAQLEQRYQVLKTNLQQIQRDLPQLRTMIKNNPTVSDVREAWIKNLQMQQHALNLMPIHYTIASNPPLSFQTLPDSAWLNVKHYPATFDMTVLHEMDLLRLIHSFKSTLGKAYLLRECTITRHQSDTTSDPISEPNFRASCDLDLFTFSSSIGF